MNNISQLESELDQREITPEVNEEIRRSKICIIDDKVADLDSMIKGLKKEGFNNVTALTEVSSVHDIVSSNYDIIVLDLSGVASHIFLSDGLGVLQEFKKHRPNIPVLVLSASTYDVAAHEMLDVADMLRTKPVLTADLVSDIELLLNRSIDKYWRSFYLYKNILDNAEEIKAGLSPFNKLMLSINLSKLQKRIHRRSDTVIMTAEKVLSIVTKAGAVANVIIKMFGS